MAELARSPIWLWIRWSYRRLRGVLSGSIDWFLGVRTTLENPAAPLQVDDPDVRAVKPSGWLTLYRVFGWLAVDSRDVLVDFGAGAGRAVIVASRFPFGRVIGIELSTAMHGLAEQNLTRLRLRRRAPVELLLCDALDYRLPDDVTVVYMFNPFTGTTFRQVVEGIFASLDRAPRRLRLVYGNPKEHDYLMGTGRCRVVKVFRGLRPTEAWARELATYVYEVTASPAP